MSRGGVVDERGAAGIAALVGGKGRGAEPGQGLRARDGGGQTAGDVLPCLPFEMKRELLAELAFDAARRDQRPDAQLQVTEIHASLITRSMAADIRSHSRASTASCRRPEAVSW